MMAVEKKPEGYHALQKDAKETLIMMVLDLKRQIIDIEKEKSNAISTINKMQRQLQVRDSELLLKDQDEMVKKILEYKARKLSPVQIQAKLELQGLEIGSEVIERILDSEWTLEMQVYFKQCEENYLETVNINPALFRVTNLTKLQVMNDKYEKMLKEDAIDDPVQQLKIMKDMQENIKKIEEIIRNVQEEKIKTGEDQEDMATTEANKWEETVGQLQERHDIEIIELEA